MVTGNKPALFGFMGELSPYIKELIIWDKGTGQPAIGEGVLNSCYELIIVLSKDSITRSFNNAAFKRGTVDNVFRIKKSKPTGMNHKAAFPIELPRKILSCFGKAGQKVFDPFMGTGTTAIAAHYGGFDFVGCELDEDYYKAACNRFENETSQMSIF